MKIYRYLAVNPVQRLTTRAINPNAGFERVGFFHVKASRQQLSSASMFSTGIVLLGCWTTLETMIVPIVSAFHKIYVNIWSGMSVWACPAIMT